MMLVSHEVPIEILEESRSFNDYDYCLLHLTLQYPEYKQFYIDSVKMGRKVLLDNSLFELGDSLTLEEVAQGVRDIHPTWVVVPDCLNNKDVTIQRFREWEKIYSDLDVLTIGVVQGSTKEELVECYKFMSQHADKIAIPFDSAGFSYHASSVLESWCRGRKEFIEDLIADGIWNYNKPHHLLGCSLAREFANPLYPAIIESIDTSNPVVAAISHLPYGVEGLDTKPSVKLCDLSEHLFSEDEHALMLYNIQMFRYICGVDRKWVAFFSQTGSEIANIIQKTGKYPFAIVTNNRDYFNKAAAEILDVLKYNCFYFIKDATDSNSYREILRDNLKLTRKDLITLHGYLRIVPADICEDYTIFNLHPGLITVHPELKGKDPQEKAYNLHLKESGVVIHKATAELDSGDVVLALPWNIENKSLDCTYKELHDLATEAWIQFLDGDR